MQQLHTEKQLMILCGLIRKKNHSLQDCKCLKHKLVTPNLKISFRLLPYPEEAKKKSVYVSKMVGKMLPRAQCGKKKM